MASRYLFSISILSLLVWTAACFNPYLRASYDDVLELDNLDFRKRSVEADQQAPKADAAADKQPLKQLADVSDDDIALALSRLSGAELESLDRFMDEESGHEMDKREANAGGYAEEEQAHQWKVSAAEADGYEDYDESDAEAGLEKRCEPRHERHRHSECSHANMHGLNKRMAEAMNGPPFRRQSSFSLAADKHVQAKINLLREKQKRQMAGRSSGEGGVARRSLTNWLPSSVQQIENNARHRDTADQQRQRQQETARSAVDFNPYFNSLIGPRGRAKREIEHDEQRSNEKYARMLEESFPNPVNAPEAGGEVLVRVKRGDGTPLTVEGPPAAAVSASPPRVL